MAKISINIKKGAIEKPKLIVGIDLGTTNSLIAYVPSGSKAPEIIPVRGRKSVPSVLHFDSHGVISVGHYAKEQLISFPEKTIYSIKRLLGKGLNDIPLDHRDLGYVIEEGDDHALIKIGVDGKSYNPIELSAEILKELKKQAEISLNAHIDAAVITVPAYFNESQRQATRDAGKLAGLEVLRIVNEPTAASLAYGLNSHVEGRILVYDLGGGTFDVSVLQLEEGIFEVLATHGDTYLGGDDIDRAIAEYWRDKASQEKIKEIPHNSELRLCAEEAKISLSLDTTYTYTRVFNSTLTLTLTYSELIEIANPVVQKTWESVSKALKDAGLVPEDIAEVVLVGGSTRIPLIYEKLKSWFVSSKINNNINPDEVVALGAAVEADVLAGNRSDVLLLDVTPLSLGIETAGGLMDVLVSRNSKIPTRVKREYTSSVDGQVNMKIAVYQGERELVADNRKLGEFELKGIPAMPAGFAKIEIQFALNADGMLQVKAEELRSGVQQTVEILPSYGLTDEQVEAMLLSGLTHANTDVEIRLLREIQNEGRQIIYTTERFIERNTNLLNDIELQGTKQRIEVVRSLCDADSREPLQQAIEDLNEFSRPFAERLMDQAVSKALKGNKIDQWG